MMNEEHLKWFICNIVNTKMIIFLFHWSWKVRMMFIKFLLYRIVIKKYLVRKLTVDDIL